MHTDGIHHITAIVGDAQENIDFYTRVLYLRLVKKTVNYDDPTTYHFYFGDKLGGPGTIITFFPWQQAHQGKIGAGQVGVTTFVVPTGSFAFWKDHLVKSGVAYGVHKRFGESYLAFCDPHGLQLELVERDLIRRSDWVSADFNEEVAIIGISGVTLYSTNPMDTIRFLETTFNLKKTESDGDYTRLQSSGEIGNRIDVKHERGDVGEMGIGTVHHIAWRAKEKKHQREWFDSLKRQGIPVTSVRDRTYFSSIYFKEPGAILYEIATDEPGFTVDEDIDTLGEKLKLPAKYEHKRQLLKEQLPKISID